MVARCSVAGFFVLAMVIGSHLAPAKDRKANSSQEDSTTPALSEAELTAQQLHDLHTERLDAAQCVADAYRTMYERGEASLSDLMAKEAAVLDAEFHLAKGKEARLAIRERQLALANEHSALVARRIESGEAPSHGAHETRLAVLDAKIALLSARSE
ncbi:MAG: hypothetical protein AAGJ46_05835 [Planctomycetota bacterium]